MRHWKKVGKATCAGIALVASTTSFAANKADMSTAALKAKSDHELRVMLVQEQHKTNEWLSVIEQRLQTDADIRSGKIIN